jgi:hypothetical protein
MEEVPTKARLVDPGSLEVGRSVATTITRSEIEGAVRSPEPPELIIDVVRMREGRPEGEARSLRVALEEGDLEQVLRTTSGDAITLTFDRKELESAIDADVEAHGLREKALLLTVAAATATGAMAAKSAAATPSSTGTAAASVAPAPISDVASNPAAPVAQPTQLVSDSRGGPGEAAAPAPISDIASNPAAPVEAAQPTQLISDSRGGPGDAGAPAPISDIASNAPVQTTEPGTGGGFSLSAPDPTEAALAGGLALAIMGAAFVTARQRHAGPRPS